MSSTQCLPWLNVYLCLIHWCLQKDFLPWLGHTCGRHHWPRLSGSCQSRIWLWFLFSKKTLVQETPQSDVPFSLQCSESLRTNSCISLSARETHISIFLRPSKLIITFSPFSLIVKRHQLWSGCCTWVSIHCQHVSAQQSQAPSPGSHLGSLENSSQRTFYQVLKSTLEVVLMTWISI